MNAHAERFNRTVQEEFADFEEELLFTDLPRFNEKLPGWLMLYNAERPHYSLEYLSPLKFLIQERETAKPEDPPESHISWTCSNYVRYYNAVVRHGVETWLSLLDDAPATEDLDAVIRNIQRLYPRTEEVCRAFGIDCD